MTTLAWILVGILFLVAVRWLLFRWFAKVVEDDGFDINVQPLSLPPFGTLRWTKHGYWEGHAQSPGWAGFCSASGSYGGTLDTTPSDGSFIVYVTPRNPRRDRTLSDAQKRAYQFQMDHAGQVADSILNALPKYYAELRQDWMLSEAAMPDITDPEKFRSLIGLSSMTIHPFLKDGLAYVGLLFVCEWDSEHQFGVMLHGLQIVGIGDHDAASEDYRPEEAKDE
jgi:hypothetical protein